MKHRTSLLALCCYFSAAIQILFAATACTYGADKCICTSKGIEYNLRPLMDSRGGKDFSIVGDQGGFTYYFQPCNLPLTTPSLSLCAHNLVSCQYSTDKRNAYGLGAINQFTVDGQPESFDLDNWYIDADNVNRQIHLHVNCSHLENLVYNGFTGMPPLPITYSFTLLTPHVCKGGGGGGGGSVSISVGLSVGSVMVIIFFALLVAYLVGGVLFLKFGRKAQGREVVPNYGFWTAIPLLIKDGFSFTFQCCIRNPAYEKI